MLKKYGLLAALALGGALLGVAFVGYKEASKSTATTSAT